MKIPVDSFHNKNKPSAPVKNTDRADVFPALKSKHSSVAAKTPLSQNTPGLQPAKPDNSPAMQDVSLISSDKAKLTNLLSSLKLPQDNLSRSIISFVRFFSLPLEPKLLNTLRREALGPKTAGREAAALGAAAAADKGLRLGEKTLNEYAAAIEGSIKCFIKENTTESPANRRINDPVRQNPEHEQENQKEQEPENQEAGTGEERDSQSNDTGGHFRDDPPPKRSVFLTNRPAEEPGRPVEKLQLQDKNPNLQRQITEILKDRPLLDLINRIPGKNGHWIVIPFSFCQESLEFTISLRIFLNKALPLSVEIPVPERLAVDIKIARLNHAAFSENARETERCWQISLERQKKGQDSAMLLSESRVEMSIFPPLNKRLPADEKYIKKELAKTLGLSPDRILIKDKPPLFTDSRDYLLRSIDEKV